MDGSEGQLWGTKSSTTATAEPESVPSSPELDKEFKGEFKGPRAGNTTETLKPKVVEAKPDFSDFSNSEDTKVTKSKVTDFSWPEQLQSPKVTTVTTPGILLKYPIRVPSVESRIADLEDRLDDLYDRIALYNVKSSHKI